MTLGSTFAADHGGKDHRQSDLEQQARQTGMYRPVAEIIGKRI